MGTVQRFYFGIKHCGGLIAGKVGSYFSGYGCNYLKNSNVPITAISSLGRVQCFSLSSTKRDCYEQFKKNIPKKIQPVCYVVFDLDGMLINSENLNVEAHDWYLARWGKKYNVHLREQVMGAGDKIGAQIIIDELDLKTVSATISPEVYIHGIWQRKKDLYINNVELMPGVEKLICHLQNNKIPVALNSSSGTKSFRLKTRNYPHLFGMFCHIVLGDDPQVGHPKPAPDIYHVTARRFVRPPKMNTEVLVFEDSPVGVKAALGAGMRVIQVPDDSLSYEGKNCGAEKVIRSVTQFKPEEYGLPPYKKEY